MENIRIDVSVFTVLEVDLREFDFTGVSKVVLTIRNMLACKPVCTREFFTPTIHTVMISPEESEKMRMDAEYDFSIVTTDGKCLKNDDNGKIELRWGAGTCRNRV